MLQTIVIALVMFAVLVSVHELGHFMAAKAVGIKIYEFSIGMGPQIFSARKGDTKYSLRAFPIGGFVSMEGEDEEDADPDSKTSFNNKKLWQKALVVCAGVMMNFLLAVFLMMVIYFLTGMPSNVIRETVPDSPAESVLLAGDEIVEIDGRQIDSWDEISSAIASSQNGFVHVGILRDGQEGISYLDIPVEKDENGVNKIGIYPAYQHDVVYAVQNGFKGTLVLCAAMGEAVKMLFTGQVGVEEVVGPVGVVNIVGDVAALGGIYVIYLTALISINLAIVNILPFPALDGGRLLFLLIPLVTRRRISPEVEMKWHYAGFLLLMGLTIFITMKDINQFIFHLF